MSVALKALRQVNNVNSFETHLAATMSGNYTPGGDACSLAASGITDPNLITPSLPGQNPPVPPTVDEEALGGNYAELIPANTLSGYKLKFYQPGGSELGAGAYPAAITGGTLTIKMIHPKGL
jgi:hypothetical protein